MLAVCRRWQRVARAAIPAVSAEAIRILGSESAVVVAFMVVHVVVAGVIADLSQCAAQLKKEQRTSALAFRHPPLNRASKKVSSFLSAQIPAVIVEISKPQHTRMNAAILYRPVLSTDCSNSLFTDRALAGAPPRPT
jgi:hypothetical protein